MHILRGLGVAKQVRDARVYTCSRRFACWVGHGEMVLRSCRALAVVLTAMMPLHLPPILSPTPPPLIRLESHPEDAANTIRDFAPAFIAFQLQSGIATQAAQIVRLASAGVAASLSHPPPS